MFGNFLIVYTGLYSFIDDVGEKHLVRYAASADRGFEVFNSVPDASRYVQYSAPLYKTSPKARGRIAYERGPGRQYKFISAGPDQRRSESALIEYLIQIENKRRIHFGFK